MAKQQKQRSRSNRSNASVSTAHAVLYGVEEGSPRGSALSACLHGAGVVVTFATTADLSTPVGALVGLKGFHKKDATYEGETPAVEFMLLANMTPSAANVLFEDMRKQDCAIERKAFLTQFNRFWPLWKLITEISKEHDALTSSTT